jgi:drug/metabolite transporter (DMT)-like permease
MIAHRQAAHVPLSAALMIVAAVACFTLFDVGVKYLAQRYPVPLLMWARYLVQAAATVAWLAPTMRMGLVRTAQPRLQILRSLVLLCSSWCFFNALRWLPLADATAINYFTPVLVVLLSVLLLKERMTKPRWAFVIAGFVGMMLIVRPGASIFHGGALYALGAAGFYAAFQLLTRKLRGEDPRVTLFYLALCGAVVMTALAPFFDHSATMPWAHIGLLVLLGAVSTAGHFLFILAFQRAPASGLTAFTYMQLVWAMLAGWIVFGQFPDHYTFTGIGIIAGSGLLLAWHERRRAQAAVAPEEPTAVD